MGSKKGLLSKSPYFIWEGRVTGPRWEARAVCMECAAALAPLTPEEPEVPGHDLPDWAQDMLLDHGFIEEPDDPTTLKNLDVITNVPDSDRDTVADTLRRTCECPMPGHDTVRIYWSKL